MQKSGFAYFVFLFFVALLLTVVIGFDGLFFKYKQIQRLDLARLRAYYTGLSAAEYYKTGLTLPQNQQSQLDLAKLKTLPGFVYKLTKSGFKIVENKGVVYFLGFSGWDLNKAEAVQIFEQKDGKLNKWSGE